VRRFVFFSSLNAADAQRTRFIRAKWLAEQAVDSSPLESIVFAPSIVYDHSDPWITLLRRVSFLPVLPVSGDGRARFQPIWAADTARCVVAALEADSERRRRYELAGPEVLSYDEMSDLVSRMAGRPRPLVHLPLPLIRSSLLAMRSLFGDSVFATWEEAELMEVSMTTERGTGDANALGVEPRRMRDVLEEG
jgi:uncharacterized protein YbjT (DUF2867 family)